MAESVPNPSLGEASNPNQLISSISVTEDLVKQATTDGDDPPAADTDSVGEAIASTNPSDQPAPNLRRSDSSRQGSPRRRSPRRSFSRRRLSRRGSSARRDGKSSVRILTERPKDADLIPEVLKCNWEKFINRFSPDEPLHIVEVLVAGDRLAQDVLKEAAKRKAAGHLKEWKRDMPVDETRITKIHDSKVWLQRVRIQSSALLDIFTRVTGHAWGTQFYTFMRPFQYLIYFHDKIKEELSRLESEAQGEAKEGRKQSHELLHLRAYVKFVEEDILPEFHSRRDRSITGNDGSPAPTKIRFTDLWYLFERGDLIFMPDRTIKRYLAERVSGIVMSAKPTHESSMRQKVWRVYHVTVPESRPYSSYSIEPWRNPFIGFIYYLDYDGAHYSPVFKEFEIPYFEGEKAIRELDFYPLRFAHNADALLEESKTIGSKFINCLNQWHMTYNGWSLITDPVGYPIVDFFTARSDRQVTPTYVDGEVIVEFNEAFNEDPQYFNDFDDTERLEAFLNMEELDAPMQGEDPFYVWDNEERKTLLTMRHEVILPSDDVDKVDPEDPILSRVSAGAVWKQIPEGDDLALLPRRVFVYSLKHSLFVPVDVNRMKEIDYRDDGFSRLQLPEGHKRMLQSAVQSHLRRKKIEKLIESGSLNTHLFTQDFIRDKGRGLIIMLHGEPGVGKTATAEAVAQTYRRPLFPISCGYLNGSRAAEATLGNVFRLANLWDCILLLDEADVLLSARTSTDDLERNSMVSVFLRMLEYYNGILFLTTNRIGKIDQAISSRIHMMLHYRRLGRPEIENIFRINADRLKEAEQQQSEASGDQPLVVVWSDIEQFISDHWKSHPKGKGAWNGRQIRNAFIVATALARAEAEHQSPEFQPQLRYWHFKQVETLSGEYAHFKQHVLGHDDAEIARLNEERDDDYEGLAGSEVNDDGKQNPMMFREGVPHNPAPWSRIGFMPQQQQQHYPPTMGGQPMNVGMVANGIGSSSHVSSFNHQSPPHQPANPTQAQSSAPWTNYTQNPGLR